MRDFLLCFAPALIFSVYYLVFWLILALQYYFGFVPVELGAERLLTATAGGVFLISLALAMFWVSRHL